MRERSVGTAALLGAAILCIAVVSTRSGKAAPPPAPESLRDVAAFASIGDPRARSEALFVEAAKVITHPRCMNCHPATRQPTQGDTMHPHRPAMFAGDADHGPVGMRCAACHSKTSVATFAPGVRSVPGDPHWALAPASMAWQGRTVGQICRQIRDPQRNGGRDLEAIHHHMTEDHLVGWAWHPGAGRTPAPGTQADFGKLIRAWIDNGAQCPA